MTAPVALETWNNIHVTAVGANRELRNRDLLFKIKEALITGNGAWTVVRSSNGVTADDSDNWNADTDLVWAVAGSAHSWIVLEQAGMGAGSLQWCIDLNYAYNYTSYITPLVSYSGGFSGGDINDRPIVSDERNIRYGNEWTVNSLYTKGANILKTTTGKCTRVFINENGSIGASMLVEDPKDVSDWWDTPFIGRIGRFALSYAFLQEASSLAVLVGSVAVQCYATCEGFQSNALPQNILFATSDYNGDWVCCPPGLMVNSTIRRGRPGAIRDMWFVSDNLNDGDYMPGDSSRGFVVVGDVLLPWDGSVMIID